MRDTCDTLRTALSRPRDGLRVNEGLVVSATAQAEELAVVAATAAQDKLATDVIAIDVSAHLALSDVFVICSGANDRQVAAIVDNVEDELRKLGHKPLHREGARDRHGSMLPYRAPVVHVPLG